MFLKRKLKILHLSVTLQGKSQPTDSFDSIQPAYIRSGHVSHRAGGSYLGDIGT